MFPRKEVQQIGQKNLHKTEVMQDTIPSYRINYFPQRYNKNLLRSTNLTLEESNKVMKKLKITQ